MTPLEQRYRRLLQLLPSPYLEVRGEEMVDTFLLSVRKDDPEADALAEVVGHPSWGERLSIVRLAFDLRCGGRHAPPRYEVLGGAVRWCVAAIVLIHAVSAVQLLIGDVWWWHTGFWMGDSPQWSAMSWVSDVGAVLWLPTLMALAMRRPRVAQVFAGLATVPVLAAALLETRLLSLGSASMDWVAWGWVVSAWLILAVDVCVVLGLAAFHPEAPGLRPRPWLIRGAVVLMVPNAALFIPGMAPWLLADGSIVWHLGAALGAGAVLLMGRGWTSEQRTQAHLGIALLCTLALARQAPYVVGFLAQDGTSTLPAFFVVSIVVQLMVTTAIGTAFAIAGLRQVRRLPRVTYAPI